MATIGVGLWSRTHFCSSPSVLALSRAYVGDALYAVAAYLLLALVKPAWTSPRLAATALAYCFFIEASQLYEAAWAQAIRANRFGALIFGRGFSVSDLGCYVVGVALAMALDHTAQRVADFRDST